MKSRIFLSPQGLTLSKSGSMMPKEFTLTLPMVASEASRRVLSVTLKQPTRAVSKSG